MAERIYLPPEVNLIVFRGHELILKACPADDPVEEWHGRVRIPGVQILESDDMDYHSALMRLKNEELHGIETDEDHRFSLHPLHVMETSLGRHHAVVFYGIETVGQEELPNHYFDVNNPPVELVPGQLELIREVARELISSGRQRDQEVQRTPESDE